MEGQQDEVLHLSESDESCTVCKDDGMATPAVSWCSLCKATFCDACLMLHNRMPISQHHSVQQLTDITEKRYFMCQTHIDKRVTLFCRNCKEPICQTCRDRIHFVCENVVEIINMLPEVRSRLHTLKQNLDAQIKTRQDKLAKMKTQTKTVMEISSKTESQIKKSSDFVVNMIRTKECDLLGKLNAVKTRNTGNYNSSPTYEEIATGEALDVPNNAARSNVTLAELPGSRNAAAREEGYETLTPKISMDTAELHHRTPEIKRSQRKVTCNIEKIDEAFKGLCLGSVEAVPFGVADLTSSLVLLETLDTKTYKDKHDPIIKDVLVMKVNNTRTIIVSSWNTTSIKSFYTQHNKQYNSTLELEERPNGITSTENNQIVATAPFSFKIFKIAAYPDLRLSSFVSTMVSYYGVAYLGQSRIAACVRNSIWTCDSKSRVDILDMEGNVLKSVHVKGIQSPDFACLSKDGNILLSDVYTKFVVCVSPEGPLLFSSKRAEPAGVAGTSSGYVLSLDKGANKVVQLSGSGEYIREILTLEDITDNAYGICLDENELVYVTTGQFIKVFSFE